MPEEPTANDHAVEPTPHANPFASPSGPHSEASGTGNVPSVTMLAVCLALALLEPCWDTYWTFFDVDLSLVQKLLEPMDNLLEGVAEGIGLALLVHALLHKRFDTLAPGHWRLIVMLTGYVGFYQYYAPQFLAAAFYLVMIWRTSEARVWKGYAWFSVAGYLLSIVLSVVTMMAAEQFDEMQDSIQVRSTLPPAVWMLWCVGALAMLINAVTLGLMFAGVLNDQRNGVKRDFYHYLGLLLPLFLSLLKWGFLLNILRSIWEIQSL